MSDTRASEKLTLSATETAKRLGVSRGLVYEMAARGKIPTIRLGDRILVPVAALEKMLKCEAKPQPSEAADKASAPVRGA